MRQIAIMYSTLTHFHGEGKVRSGSDSRDQHGTKISSANSANITKCWRSAAGLKRVKRRYQSVSRTVSQNLMRSKSG